VETDLLALELLLQSDFAEIVRAISISQGTLFPVS
jgi:hypothetical protein